MAVALEIDGCVGIDAFRSGVSCECDFLCCAEASLPAARADSTLEGMVRGFMAAPRETRRRGVTLIGHGDEGMLSTGRGDFQRGFPFITVRDPASWAALLDLVEHGSAPPLTLVGCWTGAGEDGSLLLTTLANTLNTVVRAPTGLVYCDQNRLVLDDGAELNIATPATPAPLRERDACSTGRPQGLLHFFDGVSGLLPAALRVTHVDGRPIDDELGTRMRPALNLSKPRRLGGVAAAQTGVIRVRTPLGPRTFAVHGGRVLRDMNHCDQVFCASPELPALMRAAQA